MVLGLRIAILNPSLQVRIHRIDRDRMSLENEGVNRLEIGSCYLLPEFSFRHSR